MAQLTVAARDACAGGLYEKSAHRLRASNEPVHVVSGKLRDLIAGTPKQYPADG